MKDAMQQAASSSVWRHMPSASLGQDASLSFVVRGRGDDFYDFNDYNGFSLTIFSAHHQIIHPIDLI
jgi:hypothetical protein